jgi:PAS domain S-box-containing protein
LIENGLESLIDSVAGNSGIGHGTLHEMYGPLPVALYTTDADGRITYFNAAAAKLVGRTPELGSDKWCVTSRMFLADGTPLPHDECPMATILKGGDAPVGIECIAERPDGTRFWFTPYPTVLRDTGGRITGGVNILIDITARKNAEIEANAHFKAIVEATPECVKIVARDGTLLFMNAQGIGMVDAPSAEAVTGKNVYDLIAPEHREKFREMNERVCTGQKASLEFDIVGLQGTRRHMETCAVPLRHVDGNIVQLALTRDVTQRPDAERALLLLGAIVDSSDDAIISKNLDGTITSWNKSAERLFGYTAEEIVGKSITTIIPSERLEEEPKIIARLKEGKRVDHFETQRLRKDGTLIELSLTISPVKDGSGRVIGASKIARDISAIRKAERSSVLLNAIVDSSDDAIVSKNLDGTITSWNKSAERLFGYSAEEIVGKSITTIIPPERLEEEPKIIARLKQGQRVDHIETQRLRKDGTLIDLSLTISPVKDSSGKVIGASKIARDISERKRAEIHQRRIETELRRANRDLEQFAFSASHDLQEPLRSVKIYSELLTIDYGGSLTGEAQEYLLHLRNGASRMEMLVRDLLSYTQVAQYDKPSGLASSADACSAAIANLSAVIDETEANVTAEPLPAVPVHPAHLQQLFQNLIGNAIKYRSPHRSPIVHVSADRRDGQWLFSVTDNGIGIEHEFKENIFGLFKRLHTSDEYSGTGLGLAICQRIVDRYDGRIWVESEPGRGSTFRFTLPV